jgi:FAD/FMN-containing dehydrogenase
VLTGSQGSIILDLQRMTKVIEVNDRYSYYTVEPGVTFFHIYNAIQEQKKNIWCSVPALGWGSVVGNALDRGWGYTPAGKLHLPAPLVTHRQLTHPR